MALIHASLNGNVTEGARRFFQLFHSHLSDEYHLWYQLALPEAEREIDFAIFHPRYGVWVVQLNDWRIDQIHEIDEEYCVLIENEQELLKRNPILDARENHLKVRNLLLKESDLLHQHGPMEGNLLFPVHHLAVFSHILKKELAEKGFEDRFPPYHIITADMLENFDNSKRFAEHLLLEKRFPRFYNHLGLDEAQIDLVKRIFADLAGTQSKENRDTEPEQPQTLPEAADRVESNFAPEEPSATGLNMVEKSEEPPATELEAVETIEIPEAEALPPTRDATELEVGEVTNDGENEDSVLPDAISTEDATSEEVDEDLIKSIVESIKETPLQPPRQELPSIPGPIHDVTESQVATNNIEAMEEFDVEAQLALRRVIELNHQLLQKMWSRS